MYGNFGNQENLSAMLAGSDVFNGVSVANALTKEMIKAMNRDLIIFAMANPDPEIHPEEAKAAGAKWLVQVVRIFQIRSITYWLFVEYLEGHLMCGL